MGPVLLWTILVSGMLLLQGRGPPVERVYMRPGGTGGMWHDHLLCGREVESKWLRTLANTTP